MLRKLLVLSLLCIVPAAYGQQTILCSSSVACDPTTGPTNTNTGDPLWKAFGKTNTNFLHPLFSAASLTINNSDNFDATNSLFYMPGTTLNGIGTSKSSSASGQIAPWNIYISSDTMDTCVVSGGVCTLNQGSDVALIVHHISTNHAGGRNTLFTRTFIDGTPSAPPLVGYTGAAFITSASANLTGIAGAYTNYHGSVYGINPNVICQSGMTFAQICNAQENDVSLAFGASAAEKHALTLIQTNADQVNGDFDSSALSLQSQESNRNLSFTADVQGLTSGTLTASVTNGTYDFVFGDHEQRTVVITAGTNVDWSGDSQGALATGTSITTAGFDAPWTYGINFGCYSCYPAFYDRSILIGMQTPGIGPVNARYARAGTAIDFSNVTFHTAEFKFPGLTAGVNGELTASTLQVAPVSADLSQPSWTTHGMVISAPSGITINDSTSSGTVANEDAYALAPITQTATSATTITNFSTLFVPAPTASTNVTASNTYAIHANGAVKALGITTTGAITNINVNSNFQTNIGTGSTTSNVVLGGGSNTVRTGSALISVGTTFTLGTGTGACASTSTLTGGVQAGSFLCTGTAGASTQVITLPTAVNGWVCYASDATSGVAFAQVIPVTTTSCKITGTIATTSDKVVFMALAF